MSHRTRKYWNRYIQALSTARSGHGSSVQSLQHQGFPTRAMRRSGWGALRCLYRGHRTRKKDQGTRNHDWEDTYQASRSSYDHDRTSWSPHPQIPTWNHIFIQYSPSSEFFDEDDSNNPLYLGAVCQKWRQLAWATPNLWTSLHIAPFKKYPQNLRYLPQLVEEWLERSASLPLTIRLKDRRGWDAWLYRNDEVINILNKHLERWHDMHFSIPAYYLHQLSGSSQRSILRRLVLINIDSLPPTNFSTFSMKSKPSPTDLTLVTVGLSYVDIVWSNLTVTSISSIAIDECFELIRRAPLLETLRLQNITRSSNIFPIPNTSIVHSRLHSLELLEILDESLVSGILNSLCLPSLKQWIYTVWSFPLDNMISFVGCLSSCFKLFEIDVNEFNYQHVIGFLSHLSSLAFLELRASDWIPTNELFSCLCASAQSPLYLPHLESMEFVCEISLPWNSLLQFFAPASHWRSLPVRVVVDNRRGDLYNMPTQTARLLLELVDQGIDLKIVNRDGTDLLQAYEKWLSFAHSWIQDQLYILMGIYPCNIYTSVCWFPIYEMVCDGVWKMKQERCKRKKERERGIKLRSSSNYCTDDNKPRIYMYCIAVSSRSNKHTRGVPTIFFFLFWTCLRLRSLSTAILISFAQVLVCHSECCAT